MKKTKLRRPLEMPGPTKRIDVLAPAELVDSSMELLSDYGLSLSSFIRRSLLELLADPTSTISRISPFDDVA